VTAVFGQFSGFEGAAILGEEARRSTRVNPAAIAWSLIASAAVYIFFTWIVYTAYPGPAAAGAVSVAALLGFGSSTPRRGAATLIIQYGAYLIPSSSPPT
jgi:amino acid transporter